MVVEDGSWVTLVVVAALRYGTDDVFDGHIHLLLNGEGRGWDPCGVGLEALKSVYLGLTEGGGGPVGPAAVPALGSLDVARVSEGSAVAVLLASDVTASVLFAGVVFAAEEAVYHL